MPVTGKTFPNLLADHAITTPAPDTVIPAHDGTPGGIRFDNLQAGVFGGLTADPNFSALSVATAANTSGLALLSNKGGLLQTKATGTLLTNSTVDTQLDNCPSDATNAMNTGDRLTHVIQFNVVNTSALPVIATIKEKIAAANTFQYINFPFAAFSGGVYNCWLYTEFLQGSTAVNHSQWCWLQVSPASGGSITGSPTNYSLTATPANPPTSYPPAMTIYPLALVSAAADYGTTQQQMETRFLFGTAATTISMQRISSSVSLLRA